MIQGLMINYTPIPESEVIQRASEMMRVLGLEDDEWGLISTDEVLGLYVSKAEEKDGNQLHDKTQLNPINTTAVKCLSHLARMKKLMVLYETDSRREMRRLPEYVRKVIRSVLIDRVDFCNPTIAFLPPRYMDLHTELLEHLNDSVFTYHVETLPEGGM